MGEIRDTAIIDALRRQMSIAAAKQVVAAGNLANVNTPGYARARGRFHGGARATARRAAFRSTGTSESHLHGTVSEAVGTEEVDGLPMRRDGNNVQIDRELLTMSTAAGDFARAQTALAARFRWCATRSTKDADHAEPQCSHCRQRERPQRRARAHRSRGLEPGERGVDAQRRRATPYRRRDVVLGCRRREPVRRHAAGARAPPA